MGELAAEAAALLDVWIDYSGGVVSGATMAARNVAGAIRYGGIGGAGKRLTRAEYADHIEHGRATVLVVEKTTTDADAGAPAGKANAQAALADLEKITAGLPPIELVLMANDQAGFDQADVDYLGAAAEVFAGGALVGPYGFGSYLAACGRAGLAPIGWQAGPAPSRTGTARWATWWQRNGGPAAAVDGPATPVTLVLDGVTCDVSNRLLEVPNMGDPFLSKMPVDDHGNPNPPPGSYAWYILHVEEVTNDLRNPRSAVLAAIARATAAADTADADVKASATTILAAIASGMQVTLTADQLADVEQRLATALPGYTVNITPTAPTT